MSLVANDGLSFTFGGFGLFWFWAPNDGAILLEESGIEVEEPGNVDEACVPPNANGGGGFAPNVDPAVVAGFCVEPPESAREGFPTLSNGLEDEISKGSGGF